LVRLEGCRKVGMGAYSTPFHFMLLLVYEIYGLQLTKPEKEQRGAEAYRRLRLPPGNAGAKNST
jgi:hypothetical protein